MKMRRILVFSCREYAILFVLCIFFGIPRLPAQAQADILDTDGDGVSDYEERAVYQTFWYNGDTDGDGYSDGEEIKNGYSPKQVGQTMKEADTDNDGLSDDWEIALGSNVMIRDTDGDGFLDGTEVYHGFSPTDPKPRRVEKKILVNIDDFLLSYYHDGVLLDAVPISTGRPGYLTPRGDFSVLNKVPIKTYGGTGFNFYYPDTKWNLHFTTTNWRYYIHGTYWHNDFGKINRSSGCVNVSYADMERLYNWAGEGTKILIQ